MYRIFILMTLILGFATPVEATPKNPWILCYGDQVAPDQLLHYQPIVLDANKHPNLSPLIAHKKEILGSVSLGEIRETFSYFSEVQDLEIFLSKKPEQEGSYYVDIRNPEWTRIVIETIIPRVLAQGFTGIFLDTLDIPLYLEKTYPALFKNMGQASIDLVIAIRNAFPNISIMLNRSYEILNDVGGYINYALGESVYTTYNSSTMRYEYVSQAAYHWQRSILQNAKAKHPSLTVFTLDFWNPNDVATQRKIYKTQRKNGFRPYVTSESLQEVIRER